MHHALLLFLIISLTSPAGAQHIYKCVGADGRVSLQQAQCAVNAQAKSVQRYTRQPDAPHAYGQQRSDSAPRQSSAIQSVESAQMSSTSEPSQPSIATGFVKCVSPDGRSHIRKGARCPDRVESESQKAGIVLNPVTGEQTLMVPTGGGGMMDPMTGTIMAPAGGNGVVDMRTGTRHQILNPPPEERRIQQTAQPVSRDEVCAKARAALSNPNRTIDSIRAAEARYGELCGS